VNSAEEGMPKLFTRAATLLLGDNAEGSAHPDARPLLEALGYAEGVSSDPETRHRANLLTAASRFVRVFELAAPDAPGLVSFGAEFNPSLADPMHGGDPIVGVSGVGLSLQQAFQGCIGEGIEYLSQLQTADDALEPRDAGNPATGLGPLERDFVAAFSAHRIRPEMELSWHRAARLSDGGEVLLPADLCLRRPQSRQEVKPPFSLSTGSAAGKSWEAAALHGLLELIERDAASLWWQGGDRAKSIPPGDEAEIMAATLLAQLRQGASPRRNWLLDITTDIGVPSIAAVSCMADGFGFAFGLAARPTVKAAARSAVLEMCQGELAHAVVEAKLRGRGEAALNAKDRIHRRRATMLNAARCPLLQPQPEPARHLEIAATEPAAVLRLIVDRLAQLGIEAFGRDLTRAQFGVPAARVIAPRLQALPSQITTPRLADMMARTGGGAAYTGGIALL
jgi:ribosomal protein S12 methylthiotransferase accessory factor